MDGCPEIFDRSSPEYADAAANRRFLSKAAADFASAVLPIVLVVPLWVCG